MLLDDLVRVIETLKERIAAHGTALRENETRTRMALVDPMLAALGWDTSDPALVLPEYAAAHGRADYALVAPDGKPAALIEAKKLGEALAPHRLQMLNYSNAVGVAFAGLTNGDHWELYEVFQQKPLDERRILQLSIVEATSHHCTLELLLLWRPNLATGQPTRANEPISVPPPVDSPPSHPPGPVPDSQVKPEPPLPSKSGWMPISQVNPEKGKRPPSAIRFNQGPPLTITAWNRTLIETAEWLCQEGKLTSQEGPIAVTKTRYLVALSAAHKGGTNFKNSHKTSTGLFVEANWNAKRCVELARFLLGKLGVPVDTVELRFE